MDWVDLLDARHLPGAVGRFTQTGRRIQAMKAACDAKNVAHTWALIEQEGFPA